MTPGQPNQDLIYWSSITVQWVGTHYVIQVTTTPATTLTAIGVVLLMQDYLETAFDALLAREVIAARPSGLHGMGIWGYDALGGVQLWLKELPDPDELRTTLYKRQPTCS